MLNIIIVSHFLNHMKDFMEQYWKQVVEFTLLY